MENRVPKKNYFILFSLLLPLICVRIMRAVAYYNSEMLGERFIPNLNILQVTDSVALIIIGIALFFAPGFFLTFAISLYGPVTKKERNILIALIRILGLLAVIAIALISSYSVQELINQIN
jgi:hypothetical protein